MTLPRIAVHAAIVVAWGSALAAAPRVHAPVDESDRVVLRGNVHPLAQARFDRGAVEDGFPAERLLLLLRRSEAQEAELRELIEAEHTPGNPAFHHWLNPEEFGRRFGPADADVAAVTGWLESQGFTVNQVRPGRVTVEFSGTAEQVRRAFHTGIHRYEWDGESHVANARDPEIPAALAPVIAGLAPMNDFRPRSYLKRMGRAELDLARREARPDWNYPNGPGNQPSLLVAPGDFAVQYDITPVYNGTATGVKVSGSGQSIAIVNDSNIDLSMVASFQKLFHLPANPPEVVVDGSDPGENSDSAEAYLDVEWAGAVAPSAKVILYTSDGTAITEGLYLAASRAVGDDIAGIVSTSFGICEASLGQGGNAFWEATWEQAAAQGQTAIVAAGDGGSAGCDDFNTESLAYAGLAVNGIGSTPFNVSVGGTDFYYSDYAGTVSTLNAQIATYWAGFPKGGTSGPGVSVLKTIPEQAWNNFFGYNLEDGGDPNNNPYEQIVAGGGGASSSALYLNGEANPGSGYPKPAWQTGVGVPADKVRDVPDLALFAGNGLNNSFYPICAAPGDCVNVNSAANGSAAWITGAGGTSASAPAMAGIQALVNQAAKGWQGQADYGLYRLAAQVPAAFHDVIVGGNEVLCGFTSLDCVAGAAAGQTSGFDVEKGYAAGKGYDQASGLGSVDVANLIHAWLSTKLTATSTTLAVSPLTVVHGKLATITSAVTPASGTAAPTGSVALTGNDGLSHWGGIDTLALGPTGKIAAQVDNLPGGTYQLTAVYGGDGVFAPSKSAPVTITVTPEADTLYASGWAWNPYDLYLYPLSPGMTVPYGAQILLDSQPLSGNATLGGLSQPATGYVTYTDTVGTSVTATQQPVNALGVAEWETGVFAVGSHTVAESYSGDASYKASTAPMAASFTVVPGTTTLRGGPLVTSVAAGGSVSVDVQLWTWYLPLYGKLPSGNVLVWLGSKSQSVAWGAFGTTGDGLLEAVVTFTGASVPAGILPAGASYAGDGNWQGTQVNFPPVIALSPSLTPVVKLASTVANPLPAQLFTLTATVTGASGKAAPSGAVVFYGDDENILGEGPLLNGICQVQLAGSAFPNGTSAVYAVYDGDANYNATGSNVVILRVAEPDFSLTALKAELTVAAGGSGGVTLVMRSLNAFNGVITLAATVPAGITTTLAAPAPTVLGRTTDALTVNVAAGVKAGIYPVVVTGSSAGGAIVHDALILVDVP